VLTLRGALAAESKVGLIVSVPGDCLKKLLAVLPVAEPTVSAFRMQHGSEIDPRLV
jgi:hypothetical protein